MTNEHSSLENYTSHILFEMVAKGLRKGELEIKQTATYWPPVPLSLAVLLSHSAGLLNRRSWGPIALCWMLVLSTASYLIGCPIHSALCHIEAKSFVNYYSILSPTWLTPTNWTSCRIRLYHCLTPTCFLWVSHLYPIQPVHGQGHILMFSTRCTCFSIGGWAKGQYVTVAPDRVPFMGQIEQTVYLC